MSWTTDRTISDNRLLFAIIAGVVFVAAAGGFFFWLRKN
jgi:hypothetical protein